MSRKKIMSFFDFMMVHYLKDPDRYSLAFELKRLAPRHPELKQIDSLADLMIATNVLTDPDAKAAVTGGLWCEYCTRVGRPLTGEEE